MKILFSPIEDVSRFIYTFADDILTVEYLGVIDVFDFTGIPDGELEIYNEYWEQTLVTTLAINPIISAVKENGELTLKLINFLGPEAIKAERFPETFESEGYADYLKGIEAERSPVFDVKIEEELTQ